MTTLAVFVFTSHLLKISGPLLVGFYISYEMNICKHICETFTQGCDANVDANP